MIIEHYQYVGCQSYLCLIQELSNLLKQGFEKDEFYQMQKRILQVLPSIAYPLRSLTFPQCAYIISVYTLETLRVRSPSPSFKTVFSYLKDQGITNVSLIACLRAIAGNISLTLFGFVLVLI